MADTEENDQNPAIDQTPEEPSFSPQRLYLKDLSFETPKGTALFLRQWEPKIQQDLSTTSSKLGNDLFEVALRITITVKQVEDVLYLIEAEQGGIFKITGLSDQQLSQVLNTTCPNILFPYVREIIDSTVTKASFPPIMLPPVNFDSLFIAAVNKAKADESAMPLQSENPVAH
jgi:preprotein translocase subunit SecB